MYTYNNYLPLYYFIAITGSVAFRNARFGRGVGPITLDNVACTSSEMSLLACRHNKLFMHNCNHREDAGVRCNNDSERIKNITANAIATSSASAVTVSLSWELQNTTLDEPLRFEVECLNERHRVTRPDFVNNKTNSTDLFGLLPSSHYNCCVSAVYGLYATSWRTICTPIEIPETVTNIPIEQSSASNTVGGVLGFVVSVLLLILLTFSVAAVVYLLWSRWKSNIQTRIARYRRLS